MARAAEVKPRTIVVTSCDHCPFRSRAVGASWCAAPAVITPPRDAVAMACANESAPPPLCPLRAETVVVACGV